MWLLVRQVQGNVLLRPHLGWGVGRCLSILHIFAVDMPFYLYIPWLNDFPKHPE